jgi:hypothetical protein
MKTLPLHSEPARIRAAQLLNVGAGIITLWFIYMLLVQLPFNNKVKILGFSLAALNPRLICINAQATNDSFVIMFSAICLFYLLRLIRRRSTVDLILVTVFTALAAVSKGTGLILLPVVTLMFIMGMICRNIEGVKGIKFFGFSLLAFFLVYMAAVPYFGQYWQKYKRYGTPFAINVRKDPMPYLFQRTYIRRPGIISIADTYFTFRFFDLIEKPYITHTGRNYPWHRTSLWSQFYGRTHFGHFNMWPPSWKTDSRWVLNTGRITFFLALIPTFLFLAGIFRNSSAALKELYQSLKSGKALACHPRWLHLTVFYASAAFIITFTLQYRDFSSMKIIYVLPGLISFFYLLLDGMQWFYDSILRNRKAEMLVDTILIGLLALYFLDIVYLIFQLTPGV